MLARFLDWLDEAAGGLIRITYLLAGITAVAVYFGAGHLPAMIEAPLNAALPWLLGFSLETHTYLTARRVRAAFQERNRGVLKVQLGVLAGLLAFSSWNQLQYLSLTWQPPTTGALALPTWLAYAVRALIVPAAFMAAAFLAPLAEPVTAQIESEARATHADVFKIARKQRRRMLKVAERDGRDMTGALVELVPDPEVRRIIGHAYGAIRAPLAGPITQPQPAGAPLALPAASPEVSQSPPRPRPGPGSPSAATARSARSAAPQERPAILRLTPDGPPRRAAARGGAARTHGKPVPTSQSRETDARRAWANGARTVSAMERQIGVSRATAAKWIRTFKAERGDGQAAQ